LANDPDPRVPTELLVLLRAPLLEHAMSPSAIAKMHESSTCPLRTLTRAVGGPAMEAAMSRQTVRLEMRAMRQSHRGGLAPASDAEVIEDVLHVLAHGRGRDEQAVRDRAVEQPFPGKLQDLPLPGSQPRHAAAAPLGVEVDLV